MIVLYLHSIISGAWHFYREQNIGQSLLQKRLQSKIPQRAATGRGEWGVGMVQGENMQSSY